MEVIIISLSFIICIAFSISYVLVLIAYILLVVFVNVTFLDSLIVNKLINE